MTDQIGKAESDLLAVRERGGVIKKKKGVGSGWQQQNLHTRLIKAD